MCVIMTGNAEWRAYQREMFGFITAPLAFAKAKGELVKHSFIFNLETDFFSSELSLDKKFYIYTHYIICTYVWKFGLNTLGNSGF